MSVLSLEKYAPSDCYKREREKTIPISSSTSKHKANQNNPIPNVVSHRTQGLEQYLVLVFLLYVENNLIIYIIGKSL